MNGSYWENSRRQEFMYEKQDRFQFVVVLDCYFVHILTDVI